MNVPTAAWALLGLYVLMSLVLFAMYGADKRAAVTGSQRIPEATLHLVALLGGWPGGLIAQEVFRHKTRKQPFRAVFWTTVVLNCLALTFVLAIPTVGELP